MKEKCPICQNENIKVEKKRSRDNEFLKTGHCFICNHVFLLTEYTDIYSTGEFSVIARDNRKEPNSEKIKNLEKKAYERVEFYRNFFNTSNNILEVGSSIGSFVHFLKLSGKNADGLEPDKYYSDFSKKTYNFSQHNTFLEDFNSKKKYDTVCSFHVIEYVKDPKTFIQKTYNLLNNKGKILIECPSFELHTFGKMSETIWRPHLHYFSAPSLYKLLSPYFSILNIGYYQNAIFVIAEKSTSEQFEKNEFKRYLKQAKKVYLLSKRTPSLSKKLPIKQLFIQSLIQNEKFKTLKKRGSKYLKYKLKEKSFLRKEHGKGDKLIHHITNYKGWGNNAGDIILSKCVRDVFQNKSKVRFNIQEISKTVTKKNIDEINKSKLLLIGGGGLFLPDTNKNNISGWQWAVSEDLLKSVTVPVALYAVGYNYFRNQVPDDFFIKNLKLIIEKSDFIGIRNFGSIDKINELTENKFLEKIKYQPCPTTIIRKLYPDLKQKIKSKSIAINIAFDRPLLRFGNEYEHILNSIAKSLKTYSKKGYNIYNVTHITADKRFELSLNRFNVQYKTIELQYLLPKEVFNFYNSMELVIGMRGHAQMIPFGLNTKIITLGSHDKMYWFIKDINALDWYVELKNNKNIETELNRKVFDVLEAKSNETVEKLLSEQEKIYHITQKNITELTQIIK